MERCHEEYHEEWRRCDGETDLIEIASILGMPVSKCLEYAELFSSHGVITSDLTRYLSRQNPDFPYTPQKQPLVTTA